MPSEVKLLLTDELTRRFPAGSDFVVVGYTGLSGQETSELRAVLRGRGLRMTVVKNRLAARALEQNDLGGGSQFLDGPCALITGDAEMPELCKTVADCAGKYEEKLFVRGGFMGGEPLMPEVVGRLASIPLLPVLHAQILAGIQAPMVAAAGAFQAILRSLACALEGIRKKKEEGGALPTAPESAASEDSSGETS